MALVSERLNASKPSPDIKGGKLPANAVNNNKDLDVDSKKEEPSFFGSFFSAAKNAPKKKGVAVMESVSAYLLKDAECQCSEHPAAPACDSSPSCAQ